jgi:hypothetical protein
MWKILSKIDFFFQDKKEHTISVKLQIIQEIESGKESLAVEYYS